MNELESVKERKSDLLSALEKIEHEIWALRSRVMKMKSDLSDVNPPDLKRLIGVLKEIETDTHFICDACGEREIMGCYEEFAYQLIAHGVVVKEDANEHT